MDKINLAMAELTKDGTWQQFRRSISRWTSPAGNTPAVEQEDELDEALSRLDHVRRHGRVAVFFVGIAIPLSAAPFSNWPGRRAICRGARVTVWLTLVAGSAGIVLGVLAGMGKLSKILPVRWLCDFYVWLIRGTPLLLQILFVWLAAPR